MLLLVGGGLLSRAKASRRGGGVRGRPRALGRDGRRERCGVLRRPWRSGWGLGWAGRALAWSGAVRRVDLFPAGAEGKGR